MYRDHLSDFNAWEEKDHAKNWLVFPENVGEDLSIDEVSVSNGELYTVLTNKDRHGKQGCLVAIVRGTKIHDVVDALNRIPLELRQNVKTITRDLADGMVQIVTQCFPDAEQIDDRFHVQRLMSDALQEIRVALGKEATKERNEKVRKARERGGRYRPHRYENGDSAKELLARGRHLLYKSSGKWTESQRERAKILFREFPELQQAYALTMSFRGIYEHSKDRDDARIRLLRWYESVEDQLEVFPSFEAPMQTIQIHEETIINYLNGRKTNASAESFNAKIKSFRALQKGVSDTTFFLYRLSKIYG